MALFLGILWIVGTIFLFCYSIVEENWLLLIVASISIVAITTLAVTSQQKYYNDFDAKCQAAGGQTLEYHAYHRSTQLSCVKTDSIINIH